MTIHHHRRPETEEALFEHWIEALWHWCQTFCQSVLLKFPPMERILQCRRLQTECRCGPSAPSPRHTTDQDLPDLRRHPEHRWRCCCFWQSAWLLHQVSFGVHRPVMKTYAPSSETNRCAVTRPMPLLPPVMTATLPSSFFMICLLMLVGFKFVRVEWIDSKFPTLSRYSRHVYVFDLHSIRLCHENNC